MKWMLMKPKSNKFLQQNQLTDYLGRNSGEELI